MVLETVYVTVLECVSRRPIQARGKTDSPGNGNQHFNKPIN